ncbi:MAG: DUF11 domain-containing protein [Dokdonella sp.]|uniref:DUF11 domain-containing protein n=1 Tax=Dokdonella sp. TaxID=2291710 RepID=UPI0025C6BC31|nr:DUF11 domain-containing protein [Dokdonella sp.]MBX3701525.1 DUF11 domain-containing protein [Dokdonella sp.]
MRKSLWLALACMLSSGVGAAEVTIKNDSLTDFGGAAIIWGFAAGEMAGSWLTSPCDGNLVAVQIFWRSPTGTAAASIQDSINIYRSGTFPNPGALVQSIGGPVLNDNALNEWRYLDENNTLPLSVPVSANETVVVALQFAELPVAGSDPSVVRDTDGNTPGRNVIYASINNQFGWFNSATFGVGGDWVIRGVVNCQATATTADVGVTMSANPPAYTAGAALHYTITVANAGPASASTTLVDTFPAAYQSPTWTCTPSGGASCPAGSSGNIVGAAMLPSGSQLSFVVSGTVAAGFSATLSNSMTAVVGAPITDPNPANNTGTLDLEAAVSDLIFRDGFDGVQPGLRLVPARALGYRGGR